MRLTCFLLCWLTFSAVASVNAQQGKVSIDIKSESLSRVLMQVKDQTGARILYNENLLRDVECRDLKLEGVSFRQQTAHVAGGVCRSLDAILQIWRFAILAKDCQGGVDSIYSTTL